MMKAMKTMKTLTALALCAALAFPLAACGGTPSASSSSSAVSSSQATSDTAQIPNPWAEYDTMDEAAEKAGFAFTVPDSMDGYPDRALRVMTGDETIFEVQYLDGADQICLRKAKGSGDISGDYNAYAETDTADVNGCTVTLKGSDGQVMLATWQNGEYAYSIGCYRADGAGLTADEMTALAAQIS